MYDGVRLKQEVIESCPSTLIQDRDVVTETRISKLKLSTLKNEILNLDGLGLFDIASVCDEALAQSTKYQFPKTIRDPLNVLLTELGQGFYAEIAKDPPQWMKRAVLLRSQTAFREAAIHIVGCWPEWPWPTPKSALGERIQRMINKKASLLCAKSRGIDRDLLLSNIEHHKWGETAPVTLIEDIEASLVVSCWSSWFRNAVWEIQDPETGEVDPTQVGAIYRKISSKSEYLRPEELMDELGNARVNFPHHQKDLCENLTLFKDAQASLVEPLIKNNLMLHVQEHPEIRYLTCVDIGDQDIPWKASARAGTKRKCTEFASVEPSLKASRIN